MVLIKISPAANAEAVFQQQGDVQALVFNHVPAMC